MATADGLKYLHPANITEMFKIVKAAQPIRSLYGKGFPDSMKKVRIVYTPARGDRIEFSVSIYPFSTLLDVKLAIHQYIQNHHEEFGFAEAAEEASPLFQSVLFLQEELGTEDSTSVLESRKYDALDYFFTRLGTKSPIKLLHPYEYLKQETEETRKKKGQFVTEEGGETILGVEFRSRITYEKVILEQAEGEIPPVFFLVLFRDIYQSLAQPISDADWRAFVYPYFPYLTPQQTKLDEKNKKALSYQSQVFQQGNLFTAKLDSLLEGGIPLRELTLAGIRFLQFSWPQPPEAREGLEALFYDTTVSKYRPYMRILPSSGSPISKLHMIENKPDIPDGRTLINWSREKNPTPGRDYAFAKLMIKEQMGQTFPLYMTLRMFNDLTADAILLPPKGVRKLTPTTDLDQIESYLLEGLKDTPYLKMPVHLYNSSFIYGIKLEKTDPIFTKRILLNKIKLFSSFFQQISPLEGENPLLMLRYKRVDNFATQDRVFSFITQYTTRIPLLAGKSEDQQKKTTMIEKVMEEFQIDEDEATKRVAEWWKRTEMTIPSAESKDFIMTYNPGIDIAIFGNHPFYTFHLYRVDSLQSLQRIITLLSLLFSADEKDLFVPKSNLDTLTSAEAGLVQLEREEEKEDEEEEEGDDEVETGEAAAGNKTTEEEFGVKGTKPAYLDDLLFMDEDLGEEGEGEAEAEAEAEAPSVKAEIAADVVAPAEELREVKLAGPPPKRVVAENEESVATESQEETEGDLFLKRLKEADSRLFDYTKTHPSLKKYVSQCAANVTRQPAVLSDKEYKNMRDVIYREEVGRTIQFIEYPQDEKPTKGKKEEATKVDTYKEKFYFLEYGSNPKNLHWYVCSKYFCTRDNLVLISDEFEKSGNYRRPVLNSAGVERPMNSKPADTCPFCGGKKITNRRKPALNETVLVRTTAPKSTQIHQYIGFLKATHHPEGFYLPCCFLTPKTILRRDLYFEKPRTLGLPAPAKKEEESLEELAEEDEDGGSVVSESEYPILEEMDFSISEFGDIYLYQMTQVSQRQEGVVGAEKLPLEVSIRKKKASVSQIAKAESLGKVLKPEYRIKPQVGLLPIAVDKYFAQYPQNFVRPQVPLKLKQNGAGFLRIGVENRLRFKPNSFVASIAPFFGKNTAKEFINYLESKLTPYIFLQINYGNFVHEFYEPNVPFPDEKELEKWMSDEGLMLQLNSENYQALARLYISYKRFFIKLHDDTFIKEYRHFATLCAEPNFLRGPKTRGLTFIILDLVLDEITKEEKVEVRCPAYGFNAAIHSENDFAFILRHYTGIWEPIFYVDNRPGKEPFYTIFSREKEELGLWPYPVKDRIEEFIGQCRTRTDGRLSYASMSIPPVLLPSLSELLEMFRGNASINPIGIIRDAYNHLGAVLCDITKLVGKKQYIPIPVSDDGYIKKQWIKIALDWDDISPNELVSVDTMINFYMTQLVNILKVRSDFTPTILFDQEKKEKNTFVMGAVLLMNGAMIPVSNSSNSAQVKGIALHIPDETDTLYISTEDGNDLNDGSKDSPLQTLGAAIQYGRSKGISSLEFVYNDLPLEYKQVKPEDLPWNKNKQIVYDTPENDVDAPKILYTKQKDLAELYEHFRITFANWIAVLPHGKDLRKRIQQIVEDDDIPLYEKRKRLDILFNKKPVQWMLADEEYKVSEQQALRRMDCSSQDEEKCKSSGRCSWNDSSGKCLLHVPSKVNLGYKDVSVPLLFYYRLIDEILRYGEKRRQLFERQISYMIDLDNPIRRGNEYIVPEKSAAWYDIMRLEWSQRIDEKARFLEEKSTTKEGDAYGVIGPEYSLPEGLKRELGTEEDKLAGLRRKQSSLLSILGLIGLQSNEIEPPLKPTDEKLSETQLKMLVSQTRMIVVQMDARKEPFETIIKVPSKISMTTKVFLLYIEVDEPSIVLRDPISMSLPIFSDIPKRLQEKIQEVVKPGKEVKPGSVKEKLMKKIRVKA